MEKICNAHYRFHYKAISLLPLTCIWYKNIDKALAIDDSCNTIMVMYDQNPLLRDFGLLSYLRKKHPRLKIVYLFSNIVAISGAKVYRVEEKLNSHYDMVFAFDKLDSEKYGFDHNQLIYTTKEVLPDYRDDLEYDLFYLGLAKDRYPKLIEIYEKAKEEGLKCNFTIVGVPEEDRKYTNDIHYERVPYSFAFENMAKSKCIVDIIQSNSTALTIKTCEAVILGRKLLTSNDNIVKEHFYNPADMRVYDKSMSLKEFISQSYVPYEKSDSYAFSPECLFDKVKKKYNL